MKRSIILLLAISSIIAFSCNKEKKLMKRLTATWNIEESLFTYIDSNGTDTTILDKVLNAGKIMIYDEDPENPSKKSKLYDLTIENQLGDTLFNIVGETLITDEKNKRMILQKALRDSTYQSDLVWTIVKQKKNKQTWAIYGVDSTLFYPTNNHNPGAANNWIDWSIKLKRE